MPGNPTDRAAGAVITAAYANQLRDQTVQPFASASARDAAITAPVEGMLAVTRDTDVLWIYSGSAWVALGYYSSTGGAWTSYTPTMQVTTGGAPALGTGGILTGRYQRFGRMVAVKIFCKFGTAGGLQGGSGVFGLSRPFAALALAANEVDLAGFAYHGASATHYALGQQTDGYLLTPGNGYVSTSNFGGGAWTAGSYFSITGVYETSS